MKRKCFAIASLIFTLPKVVCSQVDQKYHHEGVAEDHSDQLHTDHYYYEEYEEEVEVETLEYEEVFEFSSEDYEDDEEFEEVKNNVQVDGNCHDDHERCAFWASLGECDANPTYMRSSCKLSCNTCNLAASGGRSRRGLLEFKTYEELIELDTADDSYDIPPCVDKTRNCHRLASQGECKSDPDYMLKTCPESCKVCRFSPYYVRGADLGVPQSLIVDSTTKRQDITWLIGKARNYIDHYADLEEDYDVLSHCHNKHRLCAYWALHGECEANEAWMMSNCGPICNSCAWNDYHIRCPFDPDAEPAWEPGDLNTMFEKIVADTKYDVQVLSSPETDGPWVITIDNFITEAEAKRFIQLGYDSGYERSEQVGDLNPDGTMEHEISDDRTSTNAWCKPEDDCATDEVTLRVLDRIENLTGIPSDNGEHMQLLKYLPGQYYKLHHDFIDDQSYRIQGVRILTVFLYLNDVPEGGATYFATLDKKVEPKTGRALIWPSTLDEDPDEIDPRTGHEAQEVTRGIKYGANVWFHQYSFKGADRIGCVE